MEFTYEALNRQGQSITGKVVAENQAEAYEKLREAGVVVTNLKEITGNKKKKKGKKVGLADMSMFARQMAAMISAGIPVTQAMSTLVAQTTNATLANAIKNIASDVEGGAALSEAFLAQRPVFSDLFCSMIAAGEMGGMLDKTLLAMSNQLHKDKQLKDAVKSATSYPKMVGSFAIVILIVMLIFMVPTFQGMTAGVDDLNPITKLVYFMSEQLRSKWFVIFPGIAVIIFLVIKLIKSPPIQHFWENHKMQCPVVGELITKTILARFCRIFATLIAGGVTAVKALETAVSITEEIEGYLEKAQAYRAQVFTAMEALRFSIDAAEALTDSKDWPFPKYGELLFSI